MDDKRFKYRLRYEKTGAAAYIGHLDMISVFQRAARRAGLRARYSEGFNPHPLISVAQPLSVGFEGLSEYADIELAAFLDPGELSGRINKTLPAGIAVKGCVMFKPGELSSAALVQSAVYDIYMACMGGEAGSEPDFAAAAKAIMAAETVMVEVESKGRHQQKDIRGLIYEMAVDGLNVSAHVACGGTANLKPAVLAGELCRLAGTGLDVYNTGFCRRELRLGPDA